MNNNKLEELLEPTSMDIDELVDYLNSNYENVLFTGDATDKHKEYILNHMPNARFAPNHLNIIRASSLGEIGLNKLMNGIKDDPNSSPLYLKKPQAQRELERRLQMDGNKA